MSSGFLFTTGKSKVALGSNNDTSALKSLTTSRSNYFSELQNVTETAIRAGNYEYQIDNVGFQSSNVFTNVGLGAHTINVRDLNQCGLIFKGKFIVDYLRYFTPNDDGYHDTRNISALNGQANSKIYIFDRFGKLLKQIIAVIVG